MNLNISSWKEFEVGKLFRLEPTKGVVTEELVEGNDIPYIAAKHSLNGLSMMCQKDTFEEWISEGNCIVFVQIGAGSAGFANYLEDEFIGMSGKTSCGYIDGILNPEIGLFLETILCQERMKYSFGRSWTGDRLKKTKIKLPVIYDSNGNPKIDEERKYSTEGFIPDRSFMENYIKSLHFKPITTKNKLNKTSFKTDERKEFCLDKLFTLKGGFFNKKPEHSIEGSIPFLASTESNNGVTEYYSLEDIKSRDKVGEPDDTLDKKIYEGNCIAVTVNGSVCNAFYQIKDFTCSHDITTLYLKGCELNKYIATFLCSIIMLEKYRWSYGRKPHDVKKFGKSIIRLPIMKDLGGNPIIDSKKLYNEEGFIPDRRYMENYIKNIPYGDKI